MTAVMVLNLLHVLTAFLLVSGIVGRGFALRDAARADEIHTVAALVRLGGRFEALVRAPSIVLLGLGLLAAWRGGWPILGFLQGGSANWILVSLVLYLTLAPLILWVFLPRGRVFEGALRDARAEGRVTPALRAAFADPVVAAAHAWELIAIVLVIALMVTKPF
jgi:uncharacterized membrane protein